MRCKHACILLVIREQVHRKPYKNEVFIVLSKKYHTVRLFFYNECSCIFLKRSLLFEFCITKYGLGYMPIVKNQSNLITVFCEAFLLLLYKKDML